MDRFVGYTAGALFLRLVQWPAFFLDVQTFSSFSVGLFCCRYAFANGGAVCKPYRSFYGAVLLSAFVTGGYR
jgi:hypothetical protein